MKSNCQNVSVLLMAMFFSSTFALAKENSTNQKDSEKKTEESKESPETYEVQPKPFRIEEELAGEIVADISSEIILQPESWSDFKLKTIVDHGAKVHKGETLLTFEDDELRKAIQDVEVELLISERKLARAEQELPRLEESLRRQLQQAEEAFQRTEEDTKRYKDIERQQAIESADMNLKMAKFYLDFYKDELEQLEQMYEADDLTEETEEIVLRRQRFYVEFAKFDYELSKYNHRKTLDVIIPRRDEDIELSLKVSREALDKARIASDIDLPLAQYELEKIRTERKKSLDKHVKLLADRSLLEIKSPATGVVYYGECVDGKWSKISDMRQKLLPGKSVDKGSVILTVVDDSSRSFLITFDEKLILDIQKGMKAAVQPVAEGSEPLSASIDRISSVPISEGKFEAKLKFKDDIPEWLIPGISGKAEVTTYFNPKALLVPTKAIHTDEESGKSFVWVIEDDDKKKSWVETGRSKEDQSEILSGLEKDQVISLEEDN